MRGLVLRPPSIVPDEEDGSPFHLVVHPAQVLADDPEAEELDATEEEVRLVLELAAATGLVTPTAQGVEVGPSFADWRRSEPAQQADLLVAAWWEFRACPPPP